ncbi:MAG: hypothetical protein ACOCXH_12925 [Cyclobacteriaceae bacterium]
MKIKKILYLLPLTLMVFTSCHEFVQVDPVPCDIGMDLNHDFDGLELDYQASLAPQLFEEDHDLNSTGKVDSELLGLVDQNTNALNDDAQITLTMTGRDCEGSQKRVYTRNDLGDISCRSLYNGPVTGYIVDLKLEIKSAEYNYKRCYWDRRYIENSGMKWSHPTGILYGTWISSNRAMDDGTERNVYVHNSFNGYIYNY